MRKAAALALLLLLLVAAAFVPRARARRRAHGVLLQRVADLERQAQALRYRRSGLDPWRAMDIVQRELDWFNATFEARWRLQDAVFNYTGIAQRLLIIVPFASNMVTMRSLLGARLPRPPRIGVAASADAQCAACLFVNGVSDPADFARKVLAAVHGKPDAEFILVLGETHYVIAENLVAWLRGLNASQALFYHHGSSALLFFTRQAALRLGDASAIQSLPSALAKVARPIHKTRFHATSWSGLLLAQQRWSPDDWFPASFTELHWDFWRARGLDRTFRARVARHVELKDAV